MPLLAYIIVSQARGQQLVAPSPGMYFAVAYFVFFGSGLLSYWLDGRHTQAFILAEVKNQDVLSVLGSSSVIVTAMVIAERLAASAVKSQDRSGQEYPAARVLAQCLVVICLGSAVDVVSTLGGFHHAAAVFASHNRNAASLLAGSIGSSLWSIFSLPASSALTFLIVAHGRKRSGLTMMTLIAELALIQGISVAVFGSRLLLVSTIASAGFQYVWIKRRAPRVVVYAIAAIALGALSALILSARAASQNQLERGNIFDWFGYSIFDVSLALHSISARVGPAFASPSRAAAALSTLIPHAGSGGINIQSNRLDVISAQAIGNAAQAASSGLPPSLPTSLELAFGLGGAIICAIVVGLISGRLHSGLLSSESGLAGILIGFWGSFVFNGFKSGDLPLDGGSALRTCFYLVLLYWMCKLIVRGKRP
ncbi:hypothetical protein [Curtobacterium ammoniigenes]|uniref:hypothetical protein n=1 Tax=Curtobacterium ammoniigenes TaxID=395387 RepID=UPI0012ED0F21|nr:hypothetical protein [Curtobacterium ammoniigenes]